MKMTNDLVLDDQKKMKDRPLEKRKKSCQNKTEKVKEQREIIKNIFHIYCSVQ